MSLPRFSVDNPAIVISLTAVLLITGVVAFMSTPRRSDPEFTIPQAQVITAWPGVDAERVERLVTAPLERTLAELEEVDYISSISTPGLSTLTINIDESISATRFDAIWAKLRGQVRNAQIRLPAGVRPPVINTDYSDTAVLQLAVFHRDSIAHNAPAYTDSELADFARLIRDRLELDPGVASAEIYGDQEERIYIETSSSTWSQIGLTIDDLERALSQRNILTTGGTLESQELRLEVAPTGELTTLEDIRNLVVGRDESGAPRLLRDTGLSVRSGYKDPPERIVRFGNDSGSTPAVIVSIIMADNAKVTTLVPRLLDTVEMMQHRDRILPEDIGFEAVFNEAGFVERKISSFIGSLAQSMLIVVLIAVLLAGFRSAFVMAAAVPITMITAFGLATRMGVVLEQMSIASLIISLGLMVDNSVVVIDNSRRFMNMGHDRRDSVIRGVSEILTPTLMGTLTTVFVFLPMLFTLNGTVVQYIYSIPVVIGITLLTSWLMAMTLTSLMAHKLIKPSPDNGSGAPAQIVIRRLAHLISRFGIRPRSFKDVFSGLLGRMIRRPLLPISAVLLIFAGTTQLPIGNQFFPADLRDQFYVDVWLPQGVAIQQTDRAARDVESLLNEVGQEIASEIGADTPNLIRSIYTSVGGSGPRFALGVSPTSPTPNFAQLIVTGTDARRTELMVERLRRLAAERIAGARVIPRSFILGPPVDSPIAVRLYSIGIDDPGFGNITELRSEADRVLDQMRLPGTWDLHSSWDNVSTQIRVDIDEDLAATAGVSSEAVASTLSAYLSGETLTTLRDGDEEIPVVFRLPSADMSVGLTPNQLFVEGASGKVPLDAVADVSIGPTNYRIERRDGQRMIELKARSEAGYLPVDRFLAMKPAIERLQETMPPNLYIEYGGDFEEAGKAQVQFAMAFGIGFVLLFLILVIQFSSIAKAFVILSTLPMGLVGAVLGLFVTSEALGFMQILGLVALAGMVVNSAILYLEFADAIIKREAEKMDPSSDDLLTAAGLSSAKLHACLVEAGWVRLLPISLTALTTIGGFVPLLFAGPMWRGLAAVMIGGLTVATILTLVVLPVAYSILIEKFKYNPRRTA